MPRKTRKHAKDVSRRDAMLLGVGTVFAIPLGLDQPAQQGAPRPILAETPSGNPRFIAADKKEQLRKNRTIVVQTPYLAQFVVKKGARSQSLHFSSTEGVVRLSSPMSKAHQLAPVTDAEATQSLAGRAAREQPWLWEYAALTRIENGEMDAAIAILEAGARQAVQIEPLNVRIFDLLAGLTLRAGRDLDAVAALTNADPGLERRRQLWVAPVSRWQKRWANKDKPTSWPHPFDLTPDKRPRRVRIP